MTKVIVTSMHRGAEREDVKTPQGDLEDRPFYEAEPPGVAGKAEKGFGEIAVFWYKGHILRGRKRV